MKIYSLFLLFMMSSVFAVAQHVGVMNPAFLGNWEAVSKACIPGSLLVIKKNQLIFQDEKVKTFRVVKNDIEYDWLEITSKLKCSVSCDPKFYRIKKSDSNQIQVSYGDKISPSSSEDGLSSCWYSKK